MTARTDAGRNPAVNVSRLTHQNPHSAPQRICNDSDNTYASKNMQRQMEWPTHSAQVIDLKNKNSSGQKQHRRFTYTAADTKWIVRFSGAMMSMRERGYSHNSGPGSIPAVPPWGSAGGRGSGRFGRRCCPFWRHSIACDDSWLCCCLRRCLASCCLPALIIHARALTSPALFAYEGCVLGIGNAARARLSSVCQAITPDGKQGERHEERSKAKVQGYVQPRVDRCTLGRHAAHGKRQVRARCPMQDSGRSC